MAERVKTGIDSTQNEKTNEQLLIQAVMDDPSAFGTLYQLYVQQVFRYLCSHIGNVQEAEDVTAQTFLAAFESFARFRQNGCFAAWLFRIARYKCIDHFRKTKKFVSVDEIGELPIKNDPLLDIIQSEQAAKLATLLERLPEDERELLRLRFMAEMSFGDIAHLLQRKEDTVKKTIYRLLARLQSQAEGSNE